MAAVATPGVSGDLEELNVSVRSRNSLRWGRIYTYLTRYRVYRSSRLDDEPTDLWRDAFVALLTARASGLRYLTDLLTEAYTDSR
ncbi:hypothetical protein B1R94_12470 [Mycolicibacterium litorale]|nr:hypothetical protein B1R94_12470 [Mycolicibacterium litorale]